MEIAVIIYQIDIWYDEESSEDNGLGGNMSKI